jgi:iron complex transport system substrate-binding protein
VRRPVSLSVILVAVALGGAACGERDEPTGALPAEFPVTVAGAGVELVALEQAPARVVALDPGSAELVAAIAGSEVLAGVPAAAGIQGSSAAEVVAEDGEIDVAAAAALEPDLVIAAADTDRVDVAQVVRRAGAPLYVQPSRSVDGIVRAVLDLGLLLGRPAEARVLAGEIERDVEEVQERVAGTETVRIFVDTGFFVTVRDESLFGDLLHRANAENVAPDPGLGPISPEELAEADPDVYVITSDSGRTLEQLRRNPDTRDLRAVREGRVVVLPIETVTHPGPDVAAALQDVAVALHPDAFR